MKRLIGTAIMGLAAVAGVGGQSGKRPLSLDDLARVKELHDPQCAPDGKSVAFVVSQIDDKNDKPGSRTSGLSGSTVRTNARSPGAAKASRRRGSAPTAKYLAFTSSRPGAAKGNQVCLLDRSGGE